MDDYDPRVPLGPATQETIPTPKTRGVVIPPLTAEYRPLSGPPKTRGVPVPGWRARGPVTTPLPCSDNAARAARPAPTAVHVCVRTSANGGLDSSRRSEPHPQATPSGPRRAAASMVRHTHTSSPLSTSGLVCQTQDSHFSGFFCRCAVTGAPPRQNNTRKCSPSGPVMPRYPMFG